VTTCLDFHGLVLKVTSEDAAVGAAVRERLRRFPRASSRAPDLRFEYRGGGHGIDRPAGSGRPVYESPRGEMLHFAADDILYIDAGEGVRMICEPGIGRARVSVGRRRPTNLWLLSRPMFTLPLLELAKRRGRYGLHAAALAVDGNGILLAGGSGSGKSTLATALIRGGWDFLGDDLVFLCPDDDGVRALAFPDDLDLTDATARFFPELGGLLRRGVGDGWPKRQLPVDDVAGIRTVFECRPRALVCPRVGTSASSRLRAIAPAEALLELAPSVLLTDPSSSQAHLDALGRLVSQCRCLRLETGRDFDDLPHRLHALVAGNDDGASAEAGTDALRAPGRS
jgi:hypothetical protein